MSHHEPEESAGASLGARVAKGAAFIVATRLIVRSLGFINTLILARLLAPEDFGLVALGVTVMQLLQNVSDIGVSQTVVRYRTAERSILDTLFTLSVVRGVAVAALLLIASLFAGTFYGDPRAAWVFAGIAAVPLLTAFINPKFHEFERDLDFSKTMLSGGLDKLASVIVSVAVAVIFKSYWAIILGLVAGAFTQAVVSYLMRPYMPRFSLTSFRELMAFTGWLTGVSFVVALNNKLDVLILGRLLGAGPTGAYYMGDQLASLATVEVAQPVAKAIYPGLSELQSDPERMNRGYLRGVEVLGAIALPAALGCAFVAHDLVNLLLGAKWLAAIPVVQAFAPVTGLMLIFITTQAYAMALGRTKLIFFREVIYFALRTPLFIWATLTYGFSGAVYAAASMTVVHMGLNLALYQQLANRPFWEPILRVRRSLGASAAMAIYFFALRPAAPFITEAPMFFRLVIDVALGGGFYIGTHYVLWLVAGRPDGIEKTAFGLLEGVRKHLRARTAATS
ncbi:MAG: lipopolysaccharide biosynthesis protein [Pseudomonadota bacterium]